MFNYFPTQNKIKKQILKNFIYLFLELFSTKIVQKVLHRYTTCMH